MSLGEFVIKYQSIIAAFFGVSITLLFTYWIKYSGNIITKVYSWDVYFYETNKHMDIIPSKHHDEYDVILADLEVIFFNETEIDKSLKDVQLVVGEKLIKLKGTINLPSRQHTKVELHGSVKNNRNQVQNLVGINVKLQASYMDRNLLLRTKEKTIEKELGVVKEY
ncbi:MAG: hypothetical protein K9K76_10165 [Halanaerobiales bacterium]|nr:hypothetical protein [Halanaerobiales bacterium]